MNKANKVENSKDTNSEIRVTDRRRVYLDQEGNAEKNDATEAPSLKPTYVEELEARTKAAEKQVHDVQARFERLREQLQRETDETRQRLNRAADERAIAEKARFIATVLPALDDLHRALRASAEGVTTENLMEGVRGVAASLENAITACGAEQIVAAGEEFDPQLHEAVDIAETTEGMDGKVVEEFSRGFRIGDHLIRPARVRVGRAPRRAREAS
ncbi:MAG: nucleotide exchange factor GrpE [Pyrinomonadaceae bacterium]